VDVDVEEEEGAGEEEEEEEEEEEAVVWAGLSRLFGLFCFFVNSG